ncbi:MAG TPA: hypothetical protein VN848_09635 [Gemmatimonadales bacterium]|nr:hypothetical protein [Gemmatimonadales bacterium]
MSSPVNEVLADYVAGRTTAGEMVRAVRAAHYGAGARSEPAWRSLVETIEGSVPGALELAGTTDAPGFALKPLEGAIPGSFETALKEAARAALAAWSEPAIPSPSPIPEPVPLPAGKQAEGLWARLVRRVRALFGG